MGEVVTAFATERLGAQPQKASVTFLGSNRSRCCAMPSAPELVYLTWADVRGIR